MIRRTAGTSPCKTDHWCNQLAGRGEHWKGYIWPDILFSLSLATDLLNCQFVNMTHVHRVYLHMCFLSQLGFVSCLCFLDRSGKCDPEKILLVTYHRRRWFIVLYRSLLNASNIRHKIALFPLSLNMLTFLHDWYCMKNRNTQFWLYNVCHTMTMLVYQILHFVYWYAMIELDSF